MNDEHETKEELIYLPELTNDELLRKLKVIEEKNGIELKLAANAHLASLFVSVPIVLAMFYILLHRMITGSFGSSGLIVVLLGFVPLALMLFLRFTVTSISRRKYNSIADRHSEILLALAQRKETRALEGILSIMNIPFGGSMYWGRAMPLFVKCMKELLQAVTPESVEFSTYKYRSSLLYCLMLPDAKLREVAKKTIIECGDRQYLEPMKRYLLSPTNNNKFLAIGRKLLNFTFGKDANILFIDDEMKQGFLSAIDGLTARLEKEGKLAQLLRPSDYNPALEGKELLRPAGSSPADADPDSLLRPASQERQSPAEIARKYLPEQEQETVKTFRD